MWNQAYALGGSGLRHAAGRGRDRHPLEHYVVVDFNGFGNMVDAVDGVPVCIPEDIVDKDHGIFVRRGDPRADGDEALDYVRARYFGDEKNDLSRIKRQQASSAPSSAR